MRMAASRCRSNLLDIVADVDDDDNCRVAMQHLCRGCPNLKSLHLDPIYFLGDVILRALAQYCPLIESISTEVWEFTNTGLNALATLHNLTKLEVSSSACSSAAVQGVLRANPNIALLTIYMSDVDDALVNCIGRCCGNLKTFNISREDSLSDDVVQDLFRGCPQLESLCMYLPGGMSNIALGALFENCCKLSTLDITMGAPEDILWIAQSILHTYYPSLTKLTARGYGMTDTVLRDIFTHCGNLRYVRVTCEKLSDECIKALAENCINVDYLSLWYCTKITISGIVTVATHCTNLTSLDLREAPVNDEFLIQLSLNCRGLTSLSLYDCHSGPITEAGILAVLEECTNLTSLRIAGNMVESITSRLDLAMLKQLYSRVVFKIAVPHHEA